MKSEADAERRIKRGTSGNFSNQNDWIVKSSGAGGIEEFLTRYNAVADHYLQDLWASFFIPRPGEYYIQPARGTLVSAGCHCLQSSISEWSHGADRESDAASAVNSPANGRHKNHTAFEDRPWWQIDLGQVETISEMRVFHRSDRDHELRNFTVSASTNGIEWHKVAQRKNASFGGIDGRPLLLRDIDQRCRYIRFQLDEPGYLHFDRVEVYALH